MLIISFCWSNFCSNAPHLIGLTYTSCSTMRIMAYTWENYISSVFVLSELDTLERTYPKCTNVHERIVAIIPVFWSIILRKLSRNGADKIVRIAFHRSARIVDPKNEITRRNGNGNCIWTENPITINGKFRYNSFSEISMSAIVSKFLFL